MVWIFWIVVLRLLVRSEAALYQKPGDLPTREYDFLIVGGGLILAA
jgi:hypothetical protein